MLTVHGNAPGQPAAPVAIVGAEGAQQPTPMVDNLKDGLSRLTAVLDRNPDAPVSMLLPLIFRLKGKPFRIDEGYFPFEPVYKLKRIPRKFMLKCGRQVAKSTNWAASGILRAATIPYFNHMTITPLFEQVRKFSTNYVRPFLVESSIRNGLLLRGGDNSVLQRTLQNESILFYNFAMNSADRVRGTPADEVDFDECQDMDMDVLPVIQSNLDASEYKFERYSGTPKTFDNTIQLLWNDSSQAEWAIPHDCGYTNLCTVEADLLKMLGDRTLVCAKCGRPCDSKLGYWVHAFPDRQLTFPGYHIPQPILPLHYARPVAWAKLRETLEKKPKYALYNEVLGESLDVGLKLLTKSEIQQAAKCPPKKPREFNRNDYTHTHLGVDWGGKGKERAQDKVEFISNTALALVARKTDGRIVVPFLRIAPYQADHYAEASMVNDAAKDAKVDFIAHDFGGGGNVRESIMVGKGWSRKRIIPMTYSGSMAPSRPIVMFEPPTAQGARISYALDKSRSLLLTIQLIKSGYIELPFYDEFKRELDHLLALYEETMESPRGRPYQLVRRLPKRCDDIAHAINFGVMSIFHVSGNWPKETEDFVRQDDDDVPAWQQDDLT